jgi:O-methyltransferase involved in polyketide biosynthesis
MPEKNAQNLSGVSETLLLPLYNRAMESQRPDAMLKDEKAVELVTQMRLDFSEIRKVRIGEFSKAIRIIFTREFDRYSRDFLRRYPDAIVVHIGCGLDTRFERVDNGRVEWYDLDVPEVIKLRRKLVGGEAGRYHLLGCSVLEEDWLETVKAHAPRPILFLAEAVFIYFTEAQVKWLVLMLRDRFPGAELVFDGWKPFEIWVGNRYLSPSRFAGLMQWGVRSARQIEGWGDGIRLVDTWSFFDQPEPRLRSFRWLALFFRLFKPFYVFHFRLGEAAR